MKVKATRELVRINSLVSEIDRAYHQAASNFGLTDSIMNILYAICNYGDDVQVSELVALTSMPKQTLNSALRKCEKAGLTEIEVTSHKNKKVKLTSEGKALAEKTVIKIIDTENRELSDFTSQEREDYIRLMQKFLDMFKARIQDIKE